MPPPLKCPHGKPQHLFIGDKYVDVTAFCPVHPGGPVISEFHSKDATDVFLSMHGPYSRAHRLVTELLNAPPSDQPPPEVTDVQREFRALAHRMHGVYRRSRPRLIAQWFFELAVSMTLFFVAPVIILFNLIPIITSALPPLLRLTIGAILLGLGFFQMGWFNHDLSHKQLITDHKFLQPVIHFYGNIISGYSYDWWRKKHNQLHHPSTNVIGIDEDIDTMPLIAWDEKLAAGYESTHILRNQHKYLWVILLFLRFYWRWRSLRHVIEQRQYKELLFLLVHYTLYVMFIASLGLSLIASIVFVVAVEMIAGFGNAFVFIQSHNGKDVTAASDGPIKGDYWTHQLRSTTNVKPTPFNNFISGYLNLQIEHHLFPWMPRQLLLEVRPHVQRICKEYDLPYREYSWSESTKLVYKHLKHIASTVAHSAPRGASPSLHRPTW